MIDIIIFSPPYPEVIQKMDKVPDFRSSGDTFRAGKSIRNNYSDSDTNIGNLSF